MDTNERWISSSSQIEGQDAFWASEDFDLEAKVVEKTKEEEMMENQNGLSSSAQNDEQEAILAAANFEEAQTDGLSEVDVIDGKESTGGQIVEISIEESSRVEQTSEEVKKEENVVKMRSSKENPNLEWEIPTVIKENFRPMFMHDKLIYHVDEKIKKQYRLISLDTINPRSYKKAKKDSASEKIFNESIIDCGQITPIVVMKIKAKPDNKGKKQKKNQKQYTYDVLFGAKRVNALIGMGADLVEAVEFICDDEILLEIIKIDEVVVRTELTEIERACLLTKRQRIYEMLHPAATAANQRLKGLNVSDEINSRLKKHESFTEYAVTLTGEHRRVVQLSLQIGKNITEENIELIKGSILENRKNELLSLARLQDKELQTKAIRAVLEGKAKTVQEAVSIYRDDLVILPKVGTPEREPMQLKLDLKNAQIEIETLQKKNVELEEKVKKLETELKVVKKTKGIAVPELTIYPCTEVNTEVIQQEEGDQNE